MISLAQARKAISRFAVPRSTETLDLSSACGRVLAQDVFALQDDPSFVRSFMDGFAVRSVDVRRPGICLWVAGAVPAGRVFLRRILKGECARVATGAMLPPGSDTVVIQEETRPAGRCGVEILKAPRPGENVYPRGAFAKKGQRLLRAGRVLSVPDVGLMAAAGHRKAKVAAAPSVAVLSTGSEIVAPGSRKTPVQVWNATAPLLLAGLRAAGIEPVYLGIARDERGPLSRRIREGLKHDVLLITGAVSVGSLDLVPRALREAGARTVFHRVRMRPGKPFLFARKGRCLIFGLPGNPVSTFIGFSLLVAPALRRIMGYPAVSGKEEGVLQREVRNDSGRLSFFPARLIGRGSGGLVVYPVAYAGSADLPALARGNGFFSLGPGCRRALKGSKVRVVRMGAL